VRQACRDHNLPDPVALALDAALADCQREFVASTTHLSPHSSQQEGLFDVVDQPA
jgi:hypothetical protein